MKATSVTFILKPGTAADSRKAFILYTILQGCFFGSAVFLTISLIMRSWSDVPGSLVIAIIFFCVLVRLGKKTSETIELSTKDFKLWSPWYVKSEPWNGIRSVQIEDVDAITRKIIARGDATPASPQGPVLFERNSSSPDLPAVAAAIDALRKARPEERSDILAALDPTVFHRN